jgi:hypothetical protein
MIKKDEPGKAAVPSILQYYQNIPEMSDKNCEHTVITASFQSKI